MNNHDLPEGFKMTELGPLPEDWEVVRLGEVSEVSAGGSAPQESKYFGGSNPFVRVQHLEEDGYQVSRWDLITDEAIRKYRLRLYPSGTIVFPKSGASIRLEKRAVLGWPSYLVSHLCAVIPQQQVINGDFLFFALKSVRLASEKAEGYPTLSLSEIRARKFPLPPLPEQRAIAQVLRTVQRAKQATERVLTAARELKKSLMRHLFTYGPVPIDQVDSVRLKETEIGPVPEGWEVTSLGELADAGMLTMQNGFAEGGHNSAGDGVPHIRPFNVTTDGGIDLTQVKYVPRLAPDSVYWVRKGDIIFNNTNSEELVGKTSYFTLDGDFLLSNHMTFIRVVPATPLDAYWLANKLQHCYQTGVMRAASRRYVNQASVTLARLKGIKIPLPPLPEQQAIAEILRTVDRKIQVEERRKAALDALFKTLLHHLMTGKVRLPSEFVRPFQEESHEPR